MHITISNSIKEKWNNTVLGVITADVEYQKANVLLKEQLDLLEASIKESIIIEDIAKMQAISNTRAAYRAFGKEPARYRVSSEALTRRIVQGKGLYYINNIVDTNNLVSIKSGYALCCFDMDKIDGDVEFTIAKPGSSYKGIGKGELNIEFLPVFRDSIGYFGSPTSDSQRTMITNTTKRLLFVIVSFSGEADLQDQLTHAKESLETYCSANIHSLEVVG
ncbi:hypothetical protein EYV94_26525 [Puteibacter caeruleilacunae]|nr:hypothetical protein EYV94_26525 [Puteibacter caeruleilacunae]